LGWYDNARAEFVAPPNAPATVTLIPFVDYNQRLTSDKVLVRVGGYYFQYNKGKSYNSGTRDMKDKLVLVQKVAGSERTTLKAGLDDTNPLYSDGNIKIRVCRTFTRADGVDAMEVSIGARSTSCDSSNLRGSSNNNNNGQNQNSWSRAPPTTANNNISNRTPQGPSNTWSSWNSWSSSSRGSSQTGSWSSWSTSWSWPSSETKQTEISGSKTTDRRNYWW